MLAPQRKELIALGKMGNFFGIDGSGSYGVCAAAASLIYYYILIHKIKLPKLPTPGSALRSSSCAGEMVGMMAGHHTAPANFF